MRPLSALYANIVEQHDVDDVQRLFQDEQLTLPKRDGFSGDLELTELILGSLALTTQERICLCLGLNDFSSSDQQTLKTVLSEERAKLENSLGKEVLERSSEHNLEDTREMVRRIVSEKNLRLLKSVTANDDPAL